MSNPITKMLLYAICPLAIVVGTWSVTDYSNRPGEVGEVVTDLDTIEFGQAWASENKATVTRQTLILCYHPHCPCTLASVRMLERISNRFAVQPNMLAFAFCPAGKSNTWTESSTTSILKQISGMTVITDHDGAISKKLGVKTSGHVLVYGHNDHLLFSGGITPGRGHEGDCRSSANLRRTVDGETSELNRWHVFGCPLVTNEGSIQ